MDSLHRHRVRACRCLKQDIPEVEAIIAALVPRLETWWTQAIEDILRRGDLLLGSEEITAAPLTEIDQLSGQTPDGRTRLDIERELTDILMRMTRDAVTSFDAEVVQAVEDARDTLLLDAATALGLSLTLEQVRAAEASLGALREGAVADLQTLMVGRIDVRTPEVRRAVTGYVQAVRLPGAAQRPGAQQAVSTLREELRAILGASSPRQWVPFVADQWSYRWFNIGEFLSAREAGHTEFRAFNNPPGGPDQRTTSFCRWIHGRRVNMARIERQIREHVRAALSGDIRRLMRNWPLLPAEVASAEGPGIEARFELEASNLGLPPYHARCRTLVLPVSPTRAR